MAEHAPTRPEEHPERHEHTDVPVRALLIVGVIIIVLAIIIHVGLYFLFYVYQSAEQTLDKQRVRSAVTQPASPVPPSPPLQGIPGYHADTPREDLIRMRRHSELILNSYFPPGEDGFARIPIERAMDLIARQNRPIPPVTTRPTTRRAHGHAH